MARGDIWTVDFPVSSSSPGREQQGRRPAVVVQADTTDIGLPTTMVSMTSELAATRFAHTFHVDPTPQNGLSVPSVLLVFQLRAIDKKRLLRKIGHLEESHLSRLEVEVRNLLGIQPWV